MPVTFRKYLNWMMALRLVIALTIFLSALIIQFITRSSFPLINPLIWIVTAIFGLTVIYALLSIKFSDSIVFIYAQIAGDVLIETGLVYLTGGIDSSFSFLYMISIITASTLLYRKGAYFIASLSAICYGLLVNLLYYNKIPEFPLELGHQEISTGKVFYYLIVNIVGFFIVAFLSSRLAERLRKSDIELEQKSSHLEDLKRFHQDVINSMTSGLVSTDMKGDITYINGPGVSMLGITRNPVGKPLTELIPLRSGIFRDLQRKNSGTTSRFETSFLIDDGSRVHLGLSFSRLKNKDGEQIGYLAIFQDLTELKELEREIRIKDRMAALGQMAAGIAHEIRNPLASMKGSVQMLREDLNLKGEKKQLLDIIVKESFRLNKTIEGFLNFARGSEYNAEIIDLKQVVEESTALIKHSDLFTENHSMKLKCENDTILCYADPNQISQVVWNLSLNALEAMEEGGALEISLALRNKGKEAEMVFQDTGTGIPEDEISQIFQPFRSSDKKGLGLGLAIVYRIVEDHGGSIKAESGPEKGTVFRVRLPVTEGDAKDSKRT